MKTNSKFRRFLSNNITLYVLSLLLAFVIWFIINANSQTESNVTISNIPITVDLPQEAVDDGLQVFKNDDITASVEVTGNRITVGSLSPTDIQVVALQSNPIIAPGPYTLELSAKKNSVKTNYSFASNVTPSTINVYVDRLKEKDFTIVDELVYKVEEGYYANSSLSETVVTVTGPETEVASIDKVVVQGTLEGSTNSNSSAVFDLVFLDKDGKKISLSMSTPSVTTVKATLNALPILEVELKVDAINAPKSHPPIRVTPDKIKIAAEKSVIDSIKDGEIIIGSLNFANLLNKNNVITYDISLPNGCKNLSDSTTAKVRVDCSDYERKNLTIDSFSSDNIDMTKYSVVFNTTNIDVTVCGPADLIDEINSSNIICKVDFTDKIDADFKDSVSLELSFSFEFTEKFKECWVYGEYTAMVNVSKK